jgi:hypothetical protein
MPLPSPVDAYHESNFMCNAHQSISICIPSVSSFFIEFRRVTHEVSFVQTVFPHPSQYYTT